MKKLILDRFRNNLLTLKSTKSIKGGYGQGGWAYCGFNVEGGNYYYDAYNSTTGQFMCHLTFEQLGALCQ